MAEWLLVIFIIREQVKLGETEKVTYAMAKNDSDSKANVFRIWMPKFCCFKIEEYDNKYHKKEAIFSFILLVLFMMFVFFNLFMFVTQVACTNMLTLPGGLSWGQFGM